MDNASYQNPAVPNFDKLPKVDDELDKPIPLDLDEPIALGEVGSANADVVSHTPLNLGGPPASAPAPSGPAPAARPTSPSPVGGPSAPAPARPVASAPRPQAARSAAVVSSTDRITGVKTFFTKLHPGALEFLDEQICTWLKKNPGISVKHTNITTGDVQSKKTEPNIIITIWY